MSKTMLIDAAHSEETRVVVVGPNGLEEFDFESASLRTLKGNIYLAKVTRVEPSLQAAFVEYGGNRHGFLAFSEIHPDYYRIPVGDRSEFEEDDQSDDDDNGEVATTTTSTTRKPSPGAVVVMPTGTLLIDDVPLLGTAPVLPQEIEEGNVEYKWRLFQPTPGTLLFVFVGMC